MSTSPVNTTRFQDVTTISLISTCHGLSHFYQLVAPSLFLWMADSLQLSYSELGLGLVAFFTASALGQPLCGIVTDRIGGVRVLSLGTALYALGIASIGFSTGFISLLAASSLAGLGNSIYHPCDLTIINHRVTRQRLPLAYSFHVIGGQIGWALAPIVMVTFANVFDWRIALMVAAVPGFILSVVVMASRGFLDYPLAHKDEPAADERKSFVQMLVIPWVWMMFLFFTLHSVSLIPVQQFGQVVFHQLFDLTKEVAAGYISLYLIAGGIGSFLGGYSLSKGKGLFLPTALRSGLAKLLGQQHLQKDSHLKNHQQYKNDQQMELANSYAIIGMSLAAMSFLSITFLPGIWLPFLLFISGFCIGFVSPSRDSLVRIMTRGNNQGKAYGIVYSGLDFGGLIAPAVVGAFIDAALFRESLMVSVTGCFLAVTLVIIFSRYYCRVWAESHQGRPTQVSP